MSFLTMDNTNNNGRSKETVTSTKKIYRTLFQQLTINRKKRKCLLFVIIIPFKRIFLAHYLIDCGEHMT